MRVWPVLANAEGDIPILEKLMNSVGFSGKHACYRCALNGIWHDDARCVRCGFLSQVRRPASDGGRMALQPGRRPLCLLTMAPRLTGGFPMSTAHCSSSRVRTMVLRSPPMWPQMCSGCHQATWMSRIPLKIVDAIGLSRHNKYSLTPGPRTIA